MKIFSLLILYFLKIYRKCLMQIYKPLFKKYGRNFVFDPFGIYSFKTIQVGDDVYIGPGANFSASKSYIKIGSKVLFGPNVTIRGGNHNTSVIGKYMFDVKEKRADDDLPVIIEDDVWVGVGAIILKGVTIGRGSIVAAGSVVNKNIPAYSIAGGIPAKVLKKRFTNTEIELHERLLNCKFM
jgi:acetyltransferase-like isoleucine patch superfamily enzyme